MAAQQPDAVALKVPRGRTRAGDIDYLVLSFRELDREVGAWRDRMLLAGIRPGHRTLVMVRQGLPLIASVFAVFHLGAVPVVIDPGMGLRSFLACVARARPDAMVGIPLARLLSHLFRNAFRTVQVRVAASGSLTARLTAGKTADATRELLAPHPCDPGDLAAILFTSGSTGSPKGVPYEHGMFDAQIRAIKETYAIEPGEIDLPLLPIFALFNPALGMTTIVPEIDPRRPAAFDPAAIVRAIQQEKVTNSFGSPTLWRKIGAHCQEHGLTLPSLRRVLCAGAPVPADLWTSSRAFLPNGRLHSPYGATEALPVASIASDELPRSPQPGACLGIPVGGTEVRIIELSDGPIPTVSDLRELPADEIGEIIVCGPVVTKKYDDDPAATALAKIRDPQSAGCNALWHRMGDCGYVDRGGLLWFCGRRVERVVTQFGTLYTEPCEQVFRQHPRAARCALIGLGEGNRRIPALVVETAVKSSRDARALARELRLLALEHKHTAEIKRFYFRKKFPVDVRHNAKIHRLTLARWAATAKGFESDPKR